MYAAIKNKEVTGVYKNKKVAIKDGAVGELIHVDTEMSESILTRVYNFVMDKTVSRCRNKAKAVAEINHSSLPAPKEQAKAEGADEENPVRQASDKSHARRKGIKAQVRELLTAEPDTSIAPKYTIDELMTQTDGTKVSIQTALSDLKSEKYAGPEGALNIVKNEQKEYYIASSN